MVPEFWNILLTKMRNFPSEGAWNQPRMARNQAGFSSNKNSLSCNKGQWCFFVADRRKNTPTRCSGSPASAPEPLSDRLPVPEAGPRPFGAELAPRRGQMLSKLLVLTTLAVDTLAGVAKPPQARSHDRFHKSDNSRTPHFVIQPDNDGDRAFSK